MRHDRLRAAQDDPDALEALERTQKDAKEMSLSKTPSKVQHESPASVSATPPPAEKATKKARRQRKQASTSTSSIAPPSITSEASNDAASSSSASQENQKHSSLKDVKDIKVERDSRELETHSQSQKKAEISTDVLTGVSVKVEPPTVKQEPMAISTPEPDSRSTTPSGALRPSGQQLLSPTTAPASPGKAYVDEPLQHSSPVATNSRSSSIAVSFEINGYNRTSVCPCKCMIVQ